MESRKENDEKPPFFSSWSRIYMVVLGFLGLLIILFYWLTLAVR